jgi:antibiotic biosynthesis monooxygenase (ABM) superfamily enzyme
VALEVADQPGFDTALTSGGMFMPVALFVVRATITKEKEAAFNKWYNEHVPQVLQYNGAVSGRRYKRVMGDDKYEYMAVYEFASEEVFRKFQQSDHLKALRAEYDKHFGDVSERAGTGWVQVFP